MSERVLVNIDKFVQFHKNRIGLLDEFAKNKVHGRLIFQITFLGLESLARLLYPKENSPKTRFVELLSLPNMGFRKEEATQLYKDWRNSLIHQGFIASPWNTLEMWEEYDICFLEYPENKLRSSTELPPESMIAVYKSRIEYLENFFKKTNTKKVELT
ncbi:MAG: hypothetical protein AABW80_02695 [Nanoarchaeota archaeon]